MTLDDVAAETVGGAQRELEVDRAAPAASASELSQGLVHDLGDERAPSIAVAVRQTPLTAIESPAASSAASCVATRQPTPSAERSHADDLPDRPSVR